MDMIKKCICALLLAVICMSFATCYADETTVPRFDQTTPIEFSSGSGIRASASKIWNSVKLILQIAALSALLFTGVRYMLASADQKADIKKSTMALVIGVVVVFGTTIIIDFVTKVAGELMNV